MMMFAIAVQAAHPRQGSDPEARRIFDTVYNKVFGPQGCTLHYDVSLGAIYKSSGTIWYKEKKSKFVDRRVDSWNDGTTVYTVYRKKKVVEIHDAKSGKHDKYASKFKFTLDDFDYTMTRQGNIIELRLKQRHDAKGTIKEVRAFIDGTTYEPKSAKIKVALFWANIAISDFHSGGISDDTFVFPRTRYGSEYRYVDKR